MLTMTEFAKQLLIAQMRIDAVASGTIFADVTVALQSFSTAVTLLWQDAVPFEADQPVIRPAE